MMDLTFTEDILLLMLDENGELPLEHKPLMRYVLVGAALMDLAFMGRVDTDPKRFLIMDMAATGNPMLDRLLKRIGNLGLLNRDTQFVVEALLDESDRIREWALSSLVERGVLEREETKFLWVRTTSYPVKDERPERGAKLRILDVLLSDAPPEPRGIALVCLADACGLIKEVLSRQEMDRARPRIKQLRRMDLIGREMGNLIDDFKNVLMTLRMSG